MSVVNAQAHELEMVFKLKEIQRRNLLRATLGPVPQPERVRVFRRRVVQLPAAVELILPGEAERTRRAA